MKCLRCDNERFVEKPDAVLEQEFRGELLKVRTPAMACTKCGWTTAALRQLDTLRRLTADAFRDKHGLLTSGQIKKLRCQLEMSQRDFATFLGVGEASVKRWETWLVQEKSSDQLIRIKSQKELSKRPAGEDAPPAWISCEHPAAETADGITIQESAPASGLDPSKWNLPADLPEPGDNTQREANDDTSLTHAA
jgi:putative zinc finger/helix-turn-helix YgiT family protein